MAVSYRAVGLAWDARKQDQNDRTHASVVPLNAKVDI